MVVRAAECRLGGNAAQGITRARLVPCWGFAARRKIPYIFGPLPGFRTTGLSLVLWCGLLFGCTSNAAESGSPYGGSGAGGGGASGSTEVPASLAFEGLGDPAALRIPPNDSRTVRVVAQPPGVYPIRFGLLGDTGGASLDRSEAETNADGVAEVVLTSPETVVAFSLRASVGAQVETKALIVVADSFATLQLRPNYAGDRPIVYWVGSARIGKTCDGLPVNPEDGDLVDQAITTKEPDLPRLTSVPTGTQLVVTLRAARYIQGCAVTSNLVGDKVNELVVPVRDVPLNVGGADLDVVLSIDPATAKLDALLDKAEAVMFERFTKGHSSDMNTLLDAMAEATDPVQTSGFVTQRSRGQWDTWLTLTFGLGANTEMQRLLRAWFSTARAQLLEREMLSGRLLARDLSANTAELRLTRTFGYDPIAAGFSPALRLSVTAETGDNLVVGGAFDWFPTQLLGRVVADVAAAARAGASSAPDALASELSCERVAAELFDHGTDSTQVFPGCNLACATELCKTAVQNLWKRMTDVTASEPAKLVLSATGAAKVDDHANVASVSNGAWSANVDFATVAGKLTGNLEAVAVPRQPPTQ
jgi:hypothetical protein